MGESSEIQQQPKQQHHHQQNGSPGEPGHIDDDKHYYKLRVNINGFSLDDVKVNIIKENKINKLKINAKRVENDVKNSINSIKEYTKLFDLPTKLKIKLDTLKYNLDSDNIHLNIEFQSNATHNIYTSLDDDLCVSIIEKTANNLKNLKNIDDIKTAIENALKTKTISCNNASDTSSSNTNSPSKSLKMSNSISKQSLFSIADYTPMNVITNQDGSKTLRASIAIPCSISSISSNLASNHNDSSVLNGHDDSISTNSNHLIIQCNELTVNLDAETKYDDTVSSFSKQLRLPKGTDSKNLIYYMDKVNHSLILEAPYNTNSTH